MKTTREDLSKALSNILQLQQHASQTNTKLFDYNKVFRSIDAQFNTINHKIQESENKITQTVRLSNEKVAIYEFGEAMDKIESALKSGKSLGGASAPSIQISRKLTVGGGGAGMSAADKTRLREATETLEQHETSIRTLQQALKSLNLEQFKQEVHQVIKQLPEKVSKSTVDKLQISLSTEMNLVKTQMKEVQDGCND